MDILFIGRADGSPRAMPITGLRDALRRLGGRAYYERLPSDGSGDGAIGIRTETIHRLPDGRTVSGVAQDEISFVLKNHLTDTLDWERPADQDGVLASLYSAMCSHDLVAINPQGATLYAGATAASLVEASLLSDDLGQTPAHLTSLSDLRAFLGFS